MKKAAKFILAFFVGFYGFALIINEPNTLLIKTYIFFGAVVVALVLLMIDDFKDN